MNVVEWYVGFHPPWWSLAGIFGHVEMWGYTQDETWVFLDPRGRRTNILISHRYDDVMPHLEARFAICQTILRVQPNLDELLPIHLPMTCAAIVGHHFGVRALTPRQLKRRLLALGAEVVHETEGRSGRESRTRAPEAACGNGTGGCDAGGSA